MRPVAALGGQRRDAALAELQERRDMQQHEKQDLAESEGFEPPSPCGLADFKSAAFNRSANSPWGRHGTAVG